jgi:hypothetical protein
MIYIIGSLRNAEIPKIANAIRRQTGWEIFDDWYAAGPEADDKWREYEMARGRSYMDALKGAAARNVFAFDKRHLDRADAAILALPAGKSGHLELGYMLGRGRRGYVLLDNPDRWDVMYQFATLVTDKIEDIINAERAQQASLQEQAATGKQCVCRKADEVGQPHRTGPQEEGQGPRGSIATLQKLFNGEPNPYRIR